MKKLSIFLMFVLGFVAFQSCDDTKTYAELKEEEREAIKRFIEANEIKVIDEDTFAEQDSVTNLAENEYVFFDETGVYLQIIEKGKGETLETGRHEILARYIEEMINEDGTSDTLAYNTDPDWYPHPDEFVLTKSGSSYSGSFSSGAMSGVYGNSVPSAWMLPFNYLKPGRATADRSKVRLIAPHSEGTSTASAQVYPAYYEITYQLAR